MVTSLAALLMLCSVQVHSQAEELHGSGGRRSRERLLRPVVRPDSRHADLSVYTTDVCVCVCVSSACAASLCCRWPCSAPDESRRSDTLRRSPIISEYVILRVQLIQTPDVRLTLFVFVCRARRGLRLRPGRSKRPRRTRGLASLR